MRRGPQLGVVEVDLEASRARALDEEVAEQRAECDADEAADQAYYDTFIDCEAAYLEPCRPHGPEDPDLAGPLEDARRRGC